MCEKYAGKGDLKKKKPVEDTAEYADTVPAVERGVTPSLLLRNFLHVFYWMAFEKTVDEHSVAAAQDGF